MDKIDWLDFQKFKNKFQKLPVEEFPNNVITEIPEPLVSVRIGTYQHINFIEKAIESVLKQKTDFPFEVLIGDDESTDGTREICIEYAKKYPNIIRLFLHKRENNIRIQGKPTPLFQYFYNSFNMRGEFYACCSGDDYWIDEYKLQKQVDFLKSNKKYSMCCTEYSIIDTNGDLIEERGWNKNVNKSIDQITVFRDFKPKTQTTLTRASAIPKKLPIEIFTSPNEDNFFCALAANSGPIGYMDYVSTAYRFHNNSIWNSLDGIGQKKMQLITFLNMKKCFQKIEQQNALNHRIERTYKRLLKQSYHNGNYVTTTVYLYKYLVFKLCGL